MGRIYDQIWWVEFLEELNESQFALDFSGLGKIAFEIIGQPNNTILVNWDDVGNAKIVEDSQNLVATFSALPETWHDFLNGRFNSAQGVLLGKIKFSGSLIIAVKYANSFNHFAKISNKFNTKIK